MYVNYVAVLDVYGPSAHHEWAMGIPFPSGIGSAGPASSQPIPGGMEYRYRSTVMLYAPEYAPVLVTDEKVVDIDAGAQTYTTLKYASGGVRLTTQNCEHID